MKNKALVVIDFQNDITRNYKKIIGQVNEAIDWAAANRMHIIYIKHYNLSEKTRTFKPKTKGAELVPELKVVTDNVFEKSKASALTSEAFAKYVEKNRIAEFYITGADATGCVKSTSYNLVKAGYKVHVISDCVTSYDLKKLDDMFTYYADKGCDVKKLTDYTGAKIQFKRLDADCFNAHSLDSFIRHQTVTECWREVDNKWVLVPNPFVENWTIEQCRTIAEDIEQHMNLDQTGFGAFDGERIVGFATVSHHFFGETANYVELVCFQVSEEYRHRGIGRKLFTMICEEALRLGADKLYISGHSSKESQAAYYALGCKYAEEINEILAEKEPFDVQLEYIL